LVDLPFQNFLLSTRVASSQSHLRTREGVKRNEGAPGGQKCRKRKLVQKKKTSSSLHPPLRQSNGQREKATTLDGQYEGKSPAYPLRIARRRRRRRRRSRSRRRRRRACG
jgi:hypothetical protein